VDGGKNGEKFVVVFLGFFLGEKECVVWCGVVWMLCCLGEVEV
jgi:hypothetical protein